LTGPNVRSDYNLIYSAFGLIAPTFTTFSQYQSSTLRDAHSITINPQFVSTTNLQTNAWQLLNAGTPITYITDDILGDSRNPNHPSIGAYENSLFTNVESKSITQDNSGIICYPNPATNQLTLYYLPNANNIVTILNSIGEIVYTKQIPIAIGSNASETIDVSEFAKGIYILSLGGKSMKFVKE
jgi:hypothetical protein